MTEGLKNINKSKENSKKCSSNLQKGKEKSRAMKQKTNKKKKPTKYKMAILSSYISIITLNDLNISIKRQRLVDQNFKKITQLYTNYKKSLQIQRHRLKIKGYKKIYHTIIQTLKIKQGWLY